MSTVARLDREMYSEAEAARLLSVHQSTLHYWLEGGKFRDRTYPPVIRQTATGTRSVTWGEFVEAGLLRQYRRVHHVALAELREFIDIARSRFEVAFPLAHYQPFIGEGRRLLLDMQQKAGLGADYWLVAVAAGQPVLTQPAESYVHRVEWADDVAVAWRPHNDPASPVRMDPDVRFGLPAIRGIRTEALWEQVESTGAAFEDIATEFELTPDEVRWAYSYEVSARAAA
jgi:uncharacterized protein (DUF433 family)